MAYVHSHCNCNVARPLINSCYGSNRFLFLSHNSLNPGPISRNSHCLFERRKYHFKIRAGGQFRIKPKTNHSVSKRFKITATGKLMYRRATTQHKQRHKSRGAKARLHRNGILTSLRMIRKIKSVLHNR
ncbi:hypothetical protein MACK_003247 [Theileria orientalis]|uniref:50S ribosomal protein L35 n=1 Tax=Theileria orientalis TaxID=68886 RepID=A0A976SID8_THEOR|nr:hypothetical protein MACK_003247 [Theileria orientalis]